MLDGMQITILHLGAIHGFLGWIILIISFIISSAALKSAITPSFNGRTVLMLSWVFSCIIKARLPTAKTSFGLLRFRATIEGSFTTTSSLWIIRVLAVPKSIAISCVNQLNSPMLMYWIYMFFEDCLQNWWK